MSSTASPEDHHQTHLGIAKVQEYDEFEAPFMLPDTFNFPEMELDYGRKSTIKK